MATNRTLLLSKLKVFPMFIAKRLIPTIQRLKFILTINS